MPGVGREISMGVIAITLAFATTAQSQTRGSTSSFTEKNVEATPKRFPLKIPTSGPITLQIEILLDRSGFSPGIIDGAWGINAAKAITFFTFPDDNRQYTGESPPAVTTIDEQTYDRLRSAARPTPLVRWYTVSSGDLAGPFTPIPKNVYEQAKLKCLCYASPAEALAERFHTSPKFLAQLNQKVKIESLR